ncbi:MAG TPA: hypothetical protein VLB90_08250 [Pseudomonadales bacterium]|nr:hypothetical protein [Pseudomonadales bacterium]
MRRIVFVITCLFASFHTYADGPNYEVFPQLKSLRVNYQVESRKKQMVLYATNHEKFTILCDAAAITNKQEKTKGRETRVAPGQTITFPFTHGSYVTDVRLYLMCEATKETDDNTAPDNTTETPPEKSPGKSPEKPIIVIEEDLEKM